MENMIVCFFIGHNDQPLDVVEKVVRETGTDSFFYREFETSYLWYQQKRYGVTDFLNKWYCEPYGLPPITMGNHFSAAIAYLCTFLHRRGLTFDFVNTFQNEQNILSQKLLQENIVVIAIITTLYLFPDPIREIIRFVRQYNQTVKIVVGGPFIFYAARSLRDKEFEELCQLLEADFIVISHEGEATLVNLINALKTHKPIEQINNIQYKTSQGYRRTRIIREDNLLKENIVNWDLFDGRLSEYVHIRTAKGCPFACAFCDFIEFAGGKYQYLNVKTVEQELNTLNKIDSIHIELIDDTCNVPPERFKEMLRMFIKNKYGFQWTCQLRCQFVNDEMARLMHESGCIGVFLGLESGNDQILRNMNKQATVEEYYKGLKYLQKYNIPTTGSFIIGFPGETLDTVQDTIHFINNSGLDFYRLECWGYSEIAPISKERKKYNIEGHDTYLWKHSTMDWKTAIALQEEMMMLIDKGSVSLCDKKKTEFTIVPLLIRRGMSVSQIKQVLMVFNQGIEEKLRKPAQQEVSPYIVEQFKIACQKL